MRKEYQKPELRQLTEEEMVELAKDLTRSNYETLVEFEGDRNLSPLYQNPKRRNSPSAASVLGDDISDFLY